MKWMHLADLHIGKTVNGFSMLEDQRVVLAQIVEHVRAEGPDAVLVAGDVYDRQVPSEQAVRLYDEFLTALAKLGVPVLVVAGNHDSAERLAFGGQLLRQSGVHVCGVFDGAPQRVTLHAGGAPVHFYLMPFVKPAAVRRFFPEAGIESYNDALKAVLSAAKVDADAPNVLVAHQFFAASGAEPERSESEIQPVGGLDRVDARLCDAFDYVALGHLHGPQRVGRETVRYAGSPLKYSFSECRQSKGVTVVEMQGGAFAHRRLPLRPLHDMREVRGPLEALLDKSVVQDADPEDYLRVTLTDEREVPGALPKLRGAYPNIMLLGYDNARTRAASSFAEAPAVRHKTPFELFCELYQTQNGAALDDDLAQMVQRALRQTEETP